MKTGEKPYLCKWMEKEGAKNWIDEVTRICEQRPKKNLGTVMKSKSLTSSLLLTGWSLTELDLEILFFSASSLA